MTRRLLNLLTALSLLLCVAACVLWGRSYRVGSVFGYHAEPAPGGWDRNFYCASYSGRLSFVALSQKVKTDYERDGFFARDDRDTAVRPIPGFAGFGRFTIQGRGMGWTEVRLPHAAAVLVTAMTPAFVLGRSLRRRRRREGNLCRQCGYDLTGNVSGVCPECGSDARAGMAESC